MLLLASLYTNTHFDMVVFDFVKCVEGGSGGPPPEKFGLNVVKLCNSRHKKHGNAGDIKLIFCDDLEKGSEKNA